MTDRKIILNFLRNFDVDIKANEVDYGNTSADYVIFEKTNKKVFKVDEFRIVFHKVFGYYVTDKKEQSVDIFVRWFKNKKIKSTKKLYDYLNSCNVTLGLRDWVITDAKGEIINLNNIKDKFNKIPPNIIKRCFDDWYTDAVIDYSEKTMNEYFD